MSQRIREGQLEFDGSNGRFCHSDIPSRTLSVMVEIVDLDPLAP